GSSASFPSPTLFRSGANMPKRELSETCLRFEASHLLLASTATRKQGAKEDLLEVVSFLDRNLPRETAFWLAGIGAECCPLSLKRDRKGTRLNSSHVK